MREHKGLVGAILCIVMLIGVIYSAIRLVPAGPDDEKEAVDSLKVWYTDESMADYMNAMAVEYHEKGGIRVLPSLHSSSEYIETIYKASVDNDNAPDVFVVSNDALERAYLSGIASPIDASDEALNTLIFPQTAIDAVTYGGRKVAYPYYFETSALIYNKTYLHDMIAGKLQTESLENAEDTDGDGEPDASEDSYEALDDAGKEEMIAGVMEETIPPATFDDLLEFADSYDAPEGVETIFKWDVRDLFFNYFFIGNYINMGGPCGDDVNNINVYNNDAVKALMLFQKLNGFFAFESSDVTYDQVVSEFIEGKLIFATATSDIISRIEAASESGEFPYEYGVAMIPDLSDSMESRSLSVTETLVVNGYSNKKSDAEKFAKFLCIDHAGQLYDRTGKLPSKISVLDDKDHVGLTAFANEYSYSVPMPKLMTISNYWLLLEDTFAGVWSGDNSSKRLQQLAKQLNYQLTGEETDVDYIVLPSDEEEVEYLDEEALKREALGDQESSDSGEQE